MATDSDEAALRRRWSPEELGSYEGQWIAFKGQDVLASGSDLEDLSQPYLGEILEGTGPLFAFVTFKARA